VKLPYNVLDIKKIVLDASLADESTLALGHEIVEKGCKSVGKHL
jgi:hypothetical protein